jgi:phosphoketolase
VPNGPTSGNKRGDRRQRVVQNAAGCRASAPFFHGYPWLIHELAYRFRNHENLHVRGYKEKGNINTPLELAILNQVDRFNLVIDASARWPETYKSDLVRTF